MKNSKRFLPLILLLSFVLLLAAVGTVYAYMFHKTGDVVNEFEKAKVPCSVVETFDGTNKTSVKIKNDGNINEYLRLRLVSYWVDSNGNIVGKQSVMPEVVYDEDNWLYDENNETYYYIGKVAPGEKTPELLADPTNHPIVLTESTYSYLAPDPTTVKQTLVIIAEAVQAAPASAVEDMWAFVDVDSDGNLTEHTT